jgi:hypothetical protein
MGERVLTITAAKFEAVRGTAEAPPPGRRIYGTTDLTKTQPLVIRDEDVGQFSQIIGAEGAVLGPLEAGGTHNENVTYEDIPWWGLLALRGDVAAVLSAVTAYTRTFDPHETVDNLKAATFWQQDETQAWRMPFGLVDELEITGAVGQPWSLRATILGSDLVPVAAFTDPGARLGRETVRMGHSKLYIGAIGSDPAGQVTGTFIDFRLLIRNNFRRKFFGDGSDAMGGVGREHREIECDFTFEENASSLAERVNWTTNTPRVVAIEALGSDIAGSTGPVKKKLRLVMPGIWDGWALSSRTSNRIFTMKLRGIYDVTFAKQFRMVSVNGIADPLV